MALRVQSCYIEQRIGYLGFYFQYNNRNSGQDNNRNYDKTQDNYRNYN